MLDLRTGIAQHGRPAPTFLLIIIVESDIDRQSRGTHGAQSRINGLEVRAARPPRREGVAVTGADNHVARCELPQICAIFIGFEHRAVTDALGEKARGVAESKAVHILRTRPHRSVRKRGDGESKLSRGDVGQQSRIVLRERRIVIGHGVALATERRHMRRDGQAQDVIGRRALLRRCAKHRREEEENN